MPQHLYRICRIKRESPYHYLSVMWPLHITTAGDWRLASKAAAGDREAGDEFVKRYYTSVYGFLFALTHCRETAEELTQTTFVETWKNLRSFQGRSSLRTWVHRIAYRQYAKWLDSKPRLSAEITESATPGHELSVVDALWLHAAIDTLPRELRETFVLFYVQELSIKEVADVLAIPRGTVLSRLHTARERLRKQLSAPGEQPADPISIESNDPGGSIYEMRKASI